jgi:hypothetical protein
MAAWAFCDSSTGAPISSVMAAAMSLWRRVYSAITASSSATRSATVVNE